MGRKVSRARGSSNSQQGIPLHDEASAKIALPFWCRRMPKVGSKSHTHFNVHSPELEPGTVAACCGDWAESIREDARTRHLIKTVKPSGCVEFKTSYSREMAGIRGPKCELSKRYGGLIPGQCMASVEQLARLISYQDEEARRDELVKLKAKLERKMRELVRATT